MVWWGGVRCGEARRDVSSACGGCGIYLPFLVGFGVAILSSAHTFQPAAAWLPSLYQSSAAPDFIFTPFGGEFLYWTPFTVR